MGIGSEARDHRGAEAESCRLVGLRHQVAEPKAEAEEEKKTMKRTHRTKCQ
jgi:hypothetical protein